MTVKTNSSTIKLEQCCWKEHLHSCWVEHAFDLLGREKMFASDTDGRKGMKHWKKMLVASEEEEGELETLKNAVVGSESTVTLARRIL